VNNGILFLAFAKFASGFAKRFGTDGFCITLPQSAVISELFKIAILKLSEVKVKSVFRCRTLKDQDIVHCH